MENNLAKRVHDWVLTTTAQAAEETEFFCPTRDTFQARLDKMMQYLLMSSKLKKEDIYILAAIAGEIGNNSFDHNIGSWPNMMGVFFSYTASKENIEETPETINGCLAVIRK